jgi:hypothetical protein
MGARRGAFLQRCVNPILDFVCCLLDAFTFCLRLWLRFAGRTV